MRDRNRFYIGLILFVFGLPSIAGTGLHGLLPEHGFHEAEGGGAVFSYSPLLGGVDSALFRGGKIGLPGENAAAGHNDDCFLCRFFTRQNAEISFFLLPLLFLILGRTIEIQICFEPETTFFFHTGRSPPVVFGA